VDPDDHEGLGAAVALDDLVGDPPHGAPNVSLIHEKGHGVPGADAPTMQGGCVPTVLLSGLTGPV
jgi:hypothetical protein